MPNQIQQSVTLLLERINQGEKAAETELLEAVYEELRVMAAGKMAKLKPGQTLQATALVNEAYMKLTAGASSWENRAHFFGAAARAMRNIIVDQIKKKATEKHGGGRKRMELDSRVAHANEDDPGRLLDIEEALRRLETAHPRAARIVDLRFFVGLPDDEIAEALDISVRTVYREWSYAKAWLRRELEDTGASTGEAG